MGYIVAVSARGSFRRLHYAGSCWRVPGTHYKEFEDWGDVVPTTVHARCHDCFPAESPAVRAEEAAAAGESEDGDGSSSSSSSSADDEIFGAGAAEGAE